ncbi:hypothetical protein B0H10DRAFT_1952050 [Mycena sp. CBHHK59/15]|nr:hypothetical protein B0H10DRAFT_1952050 [Mycena sp. CBHHK59/15]
MYYINLFQESHLRLNQHDTIELPLGYSVLSRTRRPKASFEKSWGGVSIIYRSELKLKIHDDLSGPDFIVIQMGRILIYNVYIYPESTQWAGVFDKDPCEALAASLALAFTANFLIALLGDLNARTAELLANMLDAARTSMDKESGSNPSTRGRWLCRTFDDYKMAFVSGAQKFGPNSGRYTSFQGSRQTVIDYAVCSNALFPDIASFWVDDKLDGYDHAALTLNLKVNFDLQNMVFAKPHKRRKIDIVLPETTELDRLLITTLAAGKDVAKKLLALYGPIT